MKDYIIGILFLFALSGCYYDNEEELYPGGSGPCDTTITTYTGRIKGIMETRCYGCHSQQNAPAGGAGINLQDHSTLQSLAANGRLMKALNHDGASPMPKGMPKLQPCELAAIQIWVNNGAQNN